MKPNIRSVRDAGFTLMELVVVLAIIAVLGAVLRPAGGTDKSRARRLKCASDLKQIGLAFRGFAEDWNDRFPFQALNVTNYTGAPDGGTLMTSNTAPADVWMHFQLLSNELNTAKVLMCPADRSRVNASAEDFSGNTEPLGFASSGARNNSLSYFYGIQADQTKPGLLLAGDRSLAPSASRFPFSSIGHGGAVRVPTTAQGSQVSSAGEHSSWVNVAFADGSVQQLNAKALQKSLKDAEAGYGTNANLILFPQ